MKDPELEASLRLLDIQLDNWKKLHNLITYGLDKTKPIISTEQEQWKANDQDRVRATLACLNKRSAEVLILHADGFSHQEIAQALRLSPASIGKLLSRAQAAFRKEYIKRYGKPQ